MNKSNTNHGGEYLRCELSLSMFMTASEETFRHSELQLH